MLTKALARECDAAFLMLRISMLTKKWYSNSSKLVSTVFSLVQKLQRAIVFFNKIDAVLGSRRSGEQEASGMAKAEFITHWDGLISATRAKKGERIVAFGATNRVANINEAILRRTPKDTPFGLLAATQRRSNFEPTLRDTKIDRGSVVGGNGNRDARKGSRGSEGRGSGTSAGGKKAFDLDILVRLSAGMPGSGIKEAYRELIMIVLIILDIPP